MIADFFGAVWVVAWPLLLVGGPLGAIVLWLQWPRLRQLGLAKALWIVMAVVTPLVILYGVFGWHYLSFHEGLPTGDIQKAVFWAEKIITERRLPDYGASVALLNRDPVDFYTPGLHVLTAAALAASPQPLVSIGLLAIAVALATVAVGALLARELLPGRRWIFGVGLTAGLILTQLRFLRYLREPGYHWQNVVGELLLFTLLYLGIRLWRRWDWRFFSVAVITAVGLTLSHQFSTFIAFFLLAPLALLFVARHRHVAAIGALGLVLVVIGGVTLDLHRKLPHLFTTQPHLLAEVPMVSEYFTLMGPVWFGLGLIGLVLLARRQWAFAAGTGIILLLTQGPRLGIDIPPVRTLFYLAVPLSITAAYAVERASAALGRWRYALLLIVAVAAVGSWRQAFTLSHIVRTNSTLTAEQLTLVDYVKDNGGGALIDDYNRRSASWLLLSGQPTYVRLAADVSRQMSEARQSTARRQLYLKQLDFEKIFSLGSLPEVAELLAKYDLQYVTGIEGSSQAAFAANPALVERRRGGDIVLYGVEAAFETESDAILDWLLEPTTLANDIGDDEDTFEHLPASLRATRLAKPRRLASTTFRETSAPFIPLQFNVGDYVSVWWDQDKNHYPDGALELLVRFARPPAQPLTVRAPGGQAEVLPADGLPIRFEVGHVPIDDRGFITFVIQNPSQQLVSLDIIGLGLAHVP